MKHPSHSQPAPVRPAQDASVRPLQALWISILMTLLFTMLTGIMYPLAIWVIALALPGQANGSILTVNGTVVGSSLIGQAFTLPKYFHGRPSAGGYDATNSGGSNYALTNQKLLDQISRRIADIRKEDGLAADATVPADLVTASASGLDPHISVEGAMIQVKRVATARKLPEEAVKKAVEENTDSPFLGIFGTPVVNVLTLNIALDRLTP